ncbi:acyl-CoA carboxylase epsilon subunit [Streptomyces sp. NPDC006733]|uniref:acyl-CoA carboxylase epsilon subunit n=1 Tax=Streptomyces sp. NPDC006733 TaxID=3155460 RepID=UPI0034103A27
MTTPSAPTAPSTKTAPTATAAPTPTSTRPADELLIQFVRGEPDDEQVAAATVALLAVLRQKAAADDDQVGRGGQGSRPPRWTPDSYSPPGAWAYG